LVECLFALAYHLADGGGQVMEMLEVVRELEGFMEQGGQVRIRLAEVCVRGRCERRAERVLMRGDWQVDAMLMGGEVQKEGRGWEWVKGEERVKKGEVRRRYREGRKKGWPCLVGGWRLEEVKEAEGLI
jgi:hypothetical protein